MKRLYQLSALFLSLSLSASATYAGNSDTGESEAKLYSTGKKALATKDYQKATEVFKSLTDMNTGNPEYEFLAGLSYLGGPTEREKSISCFENAISKFKQDTIAETYYYLAKAYCLNGQYDKGLESLTTFKRFIIQGKKAGQIVAKDVKHLEECARFAKDEARNPHNEIEVMNMGNAVNGAEPEYAPILTPDKKYLLFTSRRATTTGEKKAFDEMYYEDIYLAERDGSSWKMASDASTGDYLFEDFNTNKQDAGVVYTQDGKRLYIYRNDKIYESIFEGGTWSQPDKMDKIDRKSKHIPSVTLTADGKKMFFVSRQKDGMGGRDLYMTEMQDDGSWGTPSSLGASINTDGDEDAPFVTGDGKTLYFSSNGHVGIGGYDIFKVEMEDDGSWTSPTNVGFPINSPADDLYFSIDEDAQVAYFSSSRFGGEGNMDLYEANLNPQPVDIQLAGVAFDPISKSPLDVVIKLEDAKTGEVIGEFTPDAETGAYNITAPSDASYKMTISENGGETYSAEFDVAKQTREYTSFQMLEIRDVNDDQGQTTAQELKVRTGLFDVEKRTKTFDNLATQSTLDDMQFLAAGDGNEEDLATYAAMFNNDNFDKSDPNYMEFSATKEFNTMIDASTAAGTFRQDFDYNEKEVDTGDDAFNSWIVSVAKVANSQDKVTIYIESSASFVPTRRFQSNKRLSKLRSDEAKEAVMKSLKDIGVDTSKISWEDKNLVQGPAYSGDFEAGMDKYQKFQYVVLQLK